MEAAALLDAHVQLKRIYTALSEALDVTRQLADAVDRDDRIAVQMLVSMRQEPTDKLSGAHQALEQQRQSLPAADTGILSSYADGGQVSAFARSSVAAMVQAGAVRGNSASRLNPGAAISRAEMAVILHRVLAR